MCTFPLLSFKPFGITFAQMCITFPQSSYNNCSKFINTLSPISLLSVLWLPKCHHCDLLKLDWTKCFRKMNCSHNEIHTLLTAHLALHFLLLSLWLSLPLFLNDCWCFRHFKCFLSSIILQMQFLPLLVSIFHPFLLLPNFYFSMARSYIFLLVLLPNLVWVEWYIKKLVGNR
jgi:hypothetical protein